MNKDTSEIKNNILSVIRTKGPGLPVQIAREIGSNPLFVSAFLSELVAEKKLILSRMRVGNSPLYMIPGQESQLERFSEHLNSKEREALGLLKERKFLKDSEQEPSIRVALRSIRDFAKPFKINDDIFWRHSSVKESEFSQKSKKESEQESKSEEKNLGIFDESEKNKEEIIEEKIEESKPIEVKERKKVKKKKSTKGSTKTKKEKFFDKVKEYLDKQDIRLKDIVSFGRGRISLIVEIDNKETFLMAYNKKRVNETDIGRASKGAKKCNLPYIVLSKGGPLKRIESLKKDLEGLSEFRKL